MTRTDNPCRIDGVDLLEASFNFLTPQARLEGKFAYIDSKGETSVGYGNRPGGWSAETMELLELLKKSMEQDMLRTLFSGESTEGSGDESHSTTGDGVPEL